MPSPQNHGHRIFPAGGLYTFGGFELGRGAGFLRFNPIEGLNFV